MTTPHPSPPADGLVKAPERDTLGKLPFII